MAELKFPTLEEFGRQGSEWALDVFEYKGHTIREWADKITTGEYQPVKHGRWIDVTTPLLASFGDCRYECSNCGYYLDYKPNNLDGKKGNAYCDCCGAKMDLKDGENE